MYCQSCGNMLPDGVKFCTNCGAKVEDAAPAAEVKTEAVTEAAPQYEPVAQAAPQQFQQQYQEPYQQFQPAPVQPKPKKNLKPFIIIGSIAVVVIVGLIVFFTVFFPELTAKHVNMANYVKVTFDKDSYVEGDISGALSIDYDRAYEEVVDDKSKITQHEFEYYFSYYETFKEAKSDDTVSKKFDVTGWRDYKTLEGRLGIRFENSDVVEINLADEIKAQNIEVLKPVKVDFFKYIDDLYYNSGINPQKVYVNLKAKKVDLDEGYKLDIEGWSAEKYYSSCSAKITKGGKDVATVYIKAESYTAPVGKKKADILVDYYEETKNDESYISGTPIIVSSKEKKYDVKAQSGLTMKQAKANIGKFIKVTKNDHKSSGKKFAISGSYLLTAKKKSNETVNKIINLYTYTYKYSFSKKTYSYTYLDVFDNCYIDDLDGNKLKYTSGYSPWSSSDSVKRAVNYMKNTYKSEYKIKKIK